MSEATAPNAAAGAPRSAGAMLREARQARGLHVAALAASIKVTQRKLEALEGDRFDELPDMTFTRALAKTVCRSLKIDPEPVLALLPEVGDRGLDRVHQGLNTTFRERPGRHHGTDASVLKRPMLWLPLLVLLAAAALLLAPPNWVPTLGGAEAPASAAPALLPSPASAPATAAETAASAAPVEMPAAASSPAEPASAMAVVPAPAPAPESMLELRVSGESWIEVIDASGAVLLRRSLQPGETIGLDGTPPLRLKVGNAAATQLRFRGQPVELNASTRDNIARLTLE